MNYGEKDDNVMVFQPRLAQLLGLNETIIINQIHYWLKKSKNIIEGRHWVYNTYENWQDQICFLSVSTIKKTIKRLESMGIIKSSNFNKSKMDKTKWYTIDYEVLQVFYEEAFQCKAKELSEDNINQSKDTDSLRTDQNEPSSGLIVAEEEVEFNQPIPETTTEITTSDNKESSGREEDKNSIKSIRGIGRMEGLQESMCRINAIIQRLRQKTAKNGQATSRQNQRGLGVGLLRCARIMWWRLRGRRIIIE